MNNDREQQASDSHSHASKDTGQMTALILGGSSGLGLATAKKLAFHGYNIIVVHRDRKTDLQQIERHFQEITSMGVTIECFNADAANAESRSLLLPKIQRLVTTLGPIKILVHSIAKGSLKSMFTKDSGALNHQDFVITLNAMALSLYDWTKALRENGLFADDVRIVSFTSEGNVRAWPGYAAVSAAKVTLEAITRSIALEFASEGIKANCIQAGATETRAFSMIPGSEKLKASALARNPNGRLTVPEDVANVVYLLSLEEAKWITGTVIKVDGGESLC